MTSEPSLLAVVADVVAFVVVVVAVVAVVALGVRLVVEEEVVDDSEGSIPEFVESIDPILLDAMSNLFGAILFGPILFGPILFDIGSNLLLESKIKFEDGSIDGCLLGISVVLGIESGAAGLRLCFVGL